MRSLRVFALFLLFAAVALQFSTDTHAAATSPKFRLNIEGVTPRQIEDTTSQAIVRDYAKAWQAMSSARESNSSGSVGDMFVGVAREQLDQALRDQQKSGVRVRYIDHGHDLRAVFYSQEGSAMQLRDSVDLEVQLLDGNSVVRSEPAKVNYIVLMTPAADHWQVRMLQAVPGF